MDDSLFGAHTGIDFTIWNGSTKIAPKKFQKICTTFRLTKLGSTICDSSSSWLEFIWLCHCHHHKGTVSFLKSLICVVQCWFGACLLVQYIEARSCLPRLWLSFSSCCLTDALLQLDKLASQMKMCSTLKSEDEGGTTTTNSNTQNRNPPIINAKKLDVYVRSEWKQKSVSTTNQGFPFFPHSIRNSMIIKFVWHNLDEESAELWFASLILCLSVIISLNMGWSSNRENCIIPFLVAWNWFVWVCLVW